MTQAAETGLVNVRFIPRQAKEDMPEIWSLCDISLIQLKNDPLFESVIVKPKIFGPLNLLGFQVAESNFLRSSSLEISLGSFHSMNHAA